MDPRRVERVREVSRKCVDAGQVPFSQVLVVHKGEVVLRDSYGWADVGSRAPIKDDSIARIYSMTKPVTCTAAMMCYEHGHFQMEEPVEIYLPEFKGIKVYEGGKLVKPRHRPNIKQLFMHTAGIQVEEGWSGGFGRPGRRGGRAELVRKAMAAEDGRAAPPLTLEEHVKRIARAPLMYHPGERWNYSSCHTVLGRLIEVWSGVPFGEFLRRHIFAPLGMVDTAFDLPEEKRGRLACNYRLGKGGVLKDISRGTDHRPPGWFHNNGAGGLLSTIDDYSSFCRCILSNLQGAAFRGVRLLGRKTCELMTMDHSTPGQRPVWGARGVGFGLGCAVCTDPTQAQGVCSAGEFYWGGGASTLFWIDPVESTVCVYFTQLVGGSPNAAPMRTVLRIAVNQAIADAAPRPYSPSTASVAARL